MHSKVMTIYKILLKSEWIALERDGVFCGSADDIRDGFIHCSTAEQSIGTYEKYFAGAPGLVIAAIDADALGDTLKWEPSRGGALFPHIYGDLPLTAVRWSRSLASIDDLRQLSQ
jgi:uncharacterized protein (DUF952 family)